MQSARLLLILAIFSISAAFLGCSGSSGPIVAKIGPEELTLKDYERQYLRNNGGPEAALKATADEKKDFLNLLVKYRLKVLEARDKGYDKDPEIVNELREYRQSLAIPYLTERELIEPNIKKLYNRRLEEVRVSHIMISYVTDTTGAQDTLATLNKAKEVLALAKQGITFDTLALKYSADTRGQKNGGDLGFFTAGLTLPVFDDAVYSLKPGEIYPHPIRTPFGYHIAKLTEKRSSRGQLRTSHILVRLPVENPGDTSAAFAKISLIHDTLKKGGNFEELAKRNSEDPGSGPNGGDIGFSEYTRLVPQYAEAAFRMKVGEVSGVVHSQFGYHIIKVTDDAPPKKMEEQRQELKDLYQRYGFQQDNEAFINGIKKKFGLKINDDVVTKIVSLIDTNQTTSAAGWDSVLTKDVRSLPLLTTTTTAMDVQRAIDKIKVTQDLQSKQLTKTGFMQIAQKLGELEAMAIETKDLEKRYPDFGMLMHEYEEGVLLFRAEQEAVWNKVSINDTMLQAYWEQHKEDYRWQDRVNFSEIFVTLDSLVMVVQDSIKAGVDFNELAARHTQRAGYRDKRGSWGFQTQDANDLAREAFNMKVGAVSQPIKFQYGQSIIKVDEKEPARTKTFKEAASEVSSKFQELESKRIEKEWIDSLRQKFSVKENYDVLQEAFKDVKAAPAKTTAK